ncbi:MAG: hypothetical protein GY913_05500 [Proteobacteria bacterium]|nr:hypothetical protein [Pseudomonadota bacterium]MCP4916358.1 hypothetical protein [Pseudomonadota bacterium]
MKHVAILGHDYDLTRLTQASRAAGHQRAWDLAHADVIFLGHAAGLTRTLLRDRGFDGPIVLLGCSCTPVPRVPQGLAADIAGILWDVEVGLAA